MTEYTEFFCKWCVFYDRVILQCIRTIWTVRRSEFDGPDPMQYADVTCIISDPEGRFWEKKIFRTDLIFPPKYFEGILGTNFRAIFGSIFIPFARVYSSPPLGF